MANAPTAAEGLDAAAVAERQRAGLVNRSPQRSSASWIAILRRNVLTRFNALLGGLLVVILVVGPLQDALFGFILVVNTAIGIIQEWHARRVLDRLTLLHAPRAGVWRSGVRIEIPAEDVVIDDVVELARGDEIVVDGVLLEGTGLELDESQLTGEAATVVKQVGDLLRSGSSVAAGSGVMRATAVGAAAFAQSVAAEARRSGLLGSELADGNTRILRLVTWALVPIAALLTWRQLSGSVGVATALRGSVAGVANMVPEGLVLLTSGAYALGALRLARRNALVRELAAVEGLARVDVLCIDKTGTLTTGALRRAALEHLDGAVPVEAVLAALRTAERNPTASLAALAGTDAAPGAPPTRVVPFSSARRWSGVELPGLGAFALGAPEALFPDGLPATLAARVAAEASLGHRVLLLARAPGGFADESLTRPLTPVALGVLAEEVRADAAATLAFLGEQGITVKVISGDDPRTVSTIAAGLGIPGAAAPVDASALVEDVAGLCALAEDRSVFGRVDPGQKRELVRTLQAGGHVVAMIGDGVNDVLALRNADLGLAMGAGSPATRAAGRVVLLDNAFAGLPQLLAEGRQVLANVERISKLFVTKTVYATLLALVVIVANVPYPFFPRDFTLVSTLTIGVPAFFLAFARATTRLRSGYLGRLAHFAVPVGTALAATTALAYLLGRNLLTSAPETRAATTLTLGVLGLWVLAGLAHPFALWKLALVGAMAAALAAAIAIPLIADPLALEVPSGRAILIALGCSAIGVVGLEVLLRLDGRLSAPLAARLGDRAHRRREHEPQADRHDHRGQVTEGRDADVAADDAGKDHEHPGAQEEPGRRRDEAEDVSHRPTPSAGGQTGRA